MFWKRRKSQSVRIPQTLLVARDADTQELLAYSPPKVGGIYYAGFTDESLAHAYWSERLDPAEFVVGGIESIDLMEIVANEADGLALDAGADSYTILAAKDIRSWIQEPQVEITES